MKKLLLLILPVLCLSGTFFLSWLDKASGWQSNWWFDCLFCWTVGFVVVAGFITLVTSVACVLGCLEKAEERSSNADTCLF